VGRDFGRLRQRKDGRWFIQLGRFGRIYSARGTRFESEEDADYVLKAIRTAVSEGTPKRQAVDRWLPASSEAHRVNQWLARWLERMRDLERAGERSREYLDELDRWCHKSGHIEEFWGRRSVHEITYAGLEEWGRWLTRRKLSAKTRHNVMAALHSFLGWLRLSGEIAVLPPFPWPKYAEHAPRLLSAEAQGRVLDAIPMPRRGIYLALALLGLRPSEAIRLRVADYQPGDLGWLTVRRTKNGEVKRLPVPDALAEWIFVQVPREARLEGAPLFRLPYPGRGRRPAGPWSQTSLRRDWRAACAAVGEQAKLYEGTKHSTATDLLRSGVQERTIQMLLGHRDARSTRRYARLADQALVEAIRRRKCGSNVAPAKTGLANSWNQRGNGGGGGNRTRGNWELPPVISATYAAPKCPSKTPPLAEPGPFPSLPSGSLPRPEI
jgi:integrase